MAAARGSAADEPRVLSVQSHTVHGYVGNRCAVFPLQLLGIEVDVINSVQFSNHTSYPHVRGTKMTGEELLELVQGLRLNGLLHYSHLLTGYVGSASFVRAVANVLVALREQNPHLTYVCDPVMGDDGRLYVAEEVVPAYRDTIVPLASVLTPNAYEAELLTGRSVRSAADALSACEALHEKGPHTVVITSLVPQDEPPGDSLLLVASTRVAQDAGGPQRLQVRIPRVHGYFTGTGDLLAALLLAWLQRHPHGLRAAVEAALAGLQGVLRATVAAAGDAAQSRERTAEVARRRELRLVQHQHLLRDPEVVLRAEPL